MSFKVTEVEKNVFFLEFNNRTELGMTFLRPQENYENPHFHGKIFELDEFKAWYKKYKKSKTFTYCKDWSGFNIPSYILKPFYEGVFKNISRREKTLLDRFRKIYDSGKRFYLIGSTKNSHAFAHELTHARFYIYDAYRNDVLDELRKHDVSLLNTILSGKMYNQNTWDDEINAYLINEDGFFKRTVNDASMILYATMIDNLHKIHKKHFEKDWKRLFKDKTNSKFNTIRFNKNNKKEFEHSLNALRWQGPLVQNSKPYLGLYEPKTRKLVSCIWLDEENEISIITDRYYRKRGLMSILLKAIINDVFKKRLKFVEAEPLNKDSLRLLKQHGFIKNENGGYIFSIE